MGAAMLAQPAGLYDVTKSRSDRPQFANPDRPPARAGASMPKSFPQEPESLTSAEPQDATDRMQLPISGQCEERFFSLELEELAQLATAAIGEEPDLGDGYAYRCFAQFAEGHHADPPAYDLVERLRDYFSACERPIVSEGATVCRLFLKLAFGDLVKRIARARPGDKFNLRKSDPLCGGAFALLDGDFEGAQQNFTAAAEDPASRIYGLAGLALLKAVDADTAGARQALKEAGGEDEDVRTFALLLDR